MNSQNISVSHSETHQDFCSLLKEKRDQKSLSLKDISQTTKIPVQSLEHLEEGNFSKLPADVFVRGFLRSYAKCVGMDANEAVDAYTRCLGALEPAPVSDELAELALQAGREIGAPSQAAASHREISALKHDDEEGSSDSRSSVSFLRGWHRKHSAQANDDHADAALPSEMRMAVGSGSHRIPESAAGASARASSEAPAPSEKKYLGRTLLQTRGEGASSMRGSRRLFVEDEIPSRKPLIIAALVLMLGSMGAMSFWMA